MAQSKRTLCVIFAHPDDETFSVGAALARYAGEGVEITLVTATTGEAGESKLAAVEQKDLGPWRERELREAARVLGIRHLRLLGFPDGGLPDHADALQAAIAGALREIRPQVVVTEDVQGVTGHTDHITVTNAVVRAVAELGEAGPLKLYEQVLPRSRAPAHLHTTPDDYITTVVDVESGREQEIAAMQAHASQVDEATLERFRSFPAPLRAHFVCVRTRVPILIPETDLFSGIAE